MHQQSSKPLEDCIALVSGATRNAGRGIAIELGLAGATVVCTGRSVRGDPSPRRCSETIEETAEMVTAAGGRGVFHQVDHTDVDQVEGLFDRVIRDHGRIDLIVNAVSGESLNDPFLQTDLRRGLQAIVDGGHSQIISTHAGARRMSDGGLIVNISDHEWDQFYALQKALINQIARCTAEEMKALGITVLTLFPGAFFKFFDVMDEAALRVRVEEDPGALKCHTPRLIGRAVVALASDSSVSTKAGLALEMKDVVREFDLTDIDGRNDFEYW